MSLIRKFSILSVIFLVSFMLILIWLIVGFEKAIMVERTKDLTILFVKFNVQNHFTSEDFYSPKTGIEYIRIKNLLYDHIINFPEIVSIKLYNSDGTVIWSEEKDIIGKNFRSNPQLMRALRGEIVGEIRKLKKNENINNQDFKRHLELYIPIYFEDSIGVGTKFTIGIPV